ncbi:MAG: 3-isopropylmalate dehydratase small subunit [Thermoprotei archaeon]|nr:3-isopropylmalate dehydratase small subunit [Thermoprotei archaeon]
MSVIRGRAWKFGDNISTDLIVPGRYFHLRSKPKELAEHAFEDINPNFARSVRRNDLVVAGENFGIGSSREHAALVFKILGVGAILAKSFARIFYRNAINLGLPVIMLDTSAIEDGDLLEVHLDEGVVIDVSKNLSLRFKPLPKFLLDILKAGGLIEYVIASKGVTAFHEV